MKKLVVLLSVVLIAGAVFSQDSKSHRPMSKWAFNNYVKRMEKPKTDKSRMKKGIRIINRNHISSNQLYKVALLFSDDEMRLGFVKEAYPRITDKSNAIVVCDAFDRFSHQTILWDYIQKQNEYYGVNEANMGSFQDYLDMQDRKKDKQRDKDLNDNNASENIVENNTETHVNDENTVEDDVKIIETENNTEENSTENNEINIVFPNAAIYTGNNKGCQEYLGDKQFLAFANSVAQYKDDEEKTKICMEYVYTYCFTTSQIMKLGVLLSGEKYRYVFFKTAYEKVYDKDNFLHVKQLLSTQDYINGINEIYEIPSSNKPRVVAEDIPSKSACELTDAEYADMKSEIRKESFSTTRAEVAKRLIREYQCPTSKQIKGLLSLFSLEEDKLDIAKYSYEFVSDKTNFGLVRDFFTSQASRNAITDYMNEF